MAWNLGALLPYSTAKEVKIKDWRLSLLYMLSFVAVFAYCLIYVLLNQKNYLEKAATDFSLRLNLQAPPSIDQMNPMTLPYCNQSGNALVYNRPTSTCLILDQFDVVFPPPQGGTIFLTTREYISELELPANCTQRTSLQCTFPDITTNNTNAYYVAGIENFTLFVDHTLIAAQFGISKPFYEMHGIFQDADGNTIREIHPGNVNDTRNIFTVSELLAAAGILDLDNEQSVTYKGDTSMRSDGVVLLVTLTYTNWVAYSFSLSSFNLGHFTYTYKVMHVSDTEYKTYETQYLNYPTKKIITNRHGIRLVFLPEGQIGRFSFPVLLIALVSSFGLLSASVIGLDFIATTILRERHVYTKYKYDNVEAEKGIALLEHRLLDK